MRQFALYLIVFAPLAVGQTKPDFQRDVRPILSDNCFQCHGPDSTSRMANLRLDLKAEAARVIVAGKPAESRLYLRVSELVAGKRMPPPYSHKSLTPPQVATLKQWIETGAPWKEHWAYQAPVQAPLPSVKAAAWAATPIDRFILARLEKEGLAPAPVADKRTLLRRVALDLTGLPPTPAEAEYFLKDTSPAAYSHMIDRYLASPHYGEHRARFWLDAARYGDTHGIHVDNFREIWPYRDWVVQAFNANQPYDRFSKEQLAGDMMPNPTLDQRIATGFIRSGVTTNEAGIIEDEYAEIYAKDRAETVGAVYLGMTVGCATCHDHKFDPISQKDFYGLGAFFRNTTQRVMDGNISDPPPFVVVPKDDDRERYTAIGSRLRTIDKEFEAVRIRSNGASMLTVKDEKAPVHEDKPFSISIKFFYPKTTKNWTLASQTDSKDKGRGWSIDVSKDVFGLKLVGDAGRTLDIRPSTAYALQPDTWNHLVFSYDGAKKQAGFDIYLNGHLVPLRATTADVPTGLKNTSEWKLDKAFAGGQIVDFRILNRAVNESEARLLGEYPEPTALTAYLTNEDAGYRRLADERHELQNEAKGIASRGVVSLVMEERKDDTPHAWVLYRGAYDQRRDRVEARTPSALPPMPESLPRNRLGLAEWLFRDENPATSRVAVNRMWQELFGTGLVKTAEDFGSQGEPPTHPELLDWLAVDFRKSGWDVKRFYKQLLLTAAYRQSALNSPIKTEKDPDNRLLSRGPRFRLDGEELRDYALAASGLLAPQLGGAPVRPYQPTGVWEAVAMDGSNTRFYKPDVGDSLYRRSLYTIWKRSAPPAAMEIFNSPTRETCVVHRERTNTPLQALVTMNDVQFVEAARVLAGAALRETIGFEARLDYVTARLLARPLDADERRIAKKAYDEYQSYYDAHPGDAKKLLNDGERKPYPGLPAVEYASMTMLTSELFNLDEVLNK